MAKAKRSATKGSPSSAPPSIVSASPASLLGPPMDLRLWSCVEGERLALRADRPSIVLPLDGAVVELTLPSGVTQLVDRTHWALLPARRTGRVLVRGQRGRLLLLGPHDGLVARVSRTYRGEIDEDGLHALLADPVVVPRTVWVEEIAYRYVFERTECEKHESDAARFLETELVKEWYFVAREANVRKGTGVAEAPLVERARAHLEGNLGAPDALAGLPRAVHASASAILRAFRKELGITPSAWLRARRLDEGLRLLRTGRFAVGEVALQVGYGNLPAFSEAFHARFGVSPSRVRG